MREPGYYWVMGNGEWEIARWDDVDNWVGESFTEWKDNDWQEIDEHRIIRKARCNDKSLEANRLFIVDKKNKVVGTIYYDKSQ